MMKKHYLLTLALTASFAVISQTTIDFESEPLASDTFNNGADQSGDFTFATLDFSNYYDTTYQFNTGFAVSNMTDITTPGYSNQYSSITGSGFNSPNYVTYYPDGIIDFNPVVGHQAMSARITNTTFAYLSMLNGDFVGKKFGDSLNANGVNDGTNGEDFFILKIYGRTYNGDTLGVVEVVLADFRFADSTEDFIVDTWLDVDLQPANPFGYLDYLSFSFESSDVGQWGINTPTYFAMDDFHYQTFLSLEELSADYKVYPLPFSDVITIENGLGNLSVTDGAGRLVFMDEINGEKTINTTMWNSGVYFITISNENGQRTKKVIK